MGKFVVHPDTLRRLESAVLVAARLIVSRVQANAHSDLSRKKADGSIVLNLDLECQQAILAALGTDRPVVAEEDETSHGLLETDEEFFAVDPIDGTTVCKRFFTARDTQVGYGPMCGLFRHRTLLAAAFYHVPRRTLFTAVRGEGCYQALLESIPDSLPALRSRQRLSIGRVEPLHQSVVLFYPSRHGEARLAEALRSKNRIETVFRFGGFANDCSRVASGFEQAVIQYLVKPWNLPAALFPIESGLAAVFDPLRKRVPFADWQVSHENPVIIAHPSVLPDILAELDSFCPHESSN